MAPFAKDALLDWCSRRLWERSGKRYVDWCVEQKPTLDWSIPNIPLFLLSLSAGDTVLSRLGDGLRGF